MKDSIHEKTRRFLNEHQAANYIGLSTKTLQRLRLNGRGMPYVKAGARVLYDLNDLNQFMEDKKVLSTSSNLMGV